MGKLNLVKITPSDFDLLEVKDPYTIYWLDNGEIYIGSHSYGNNADISKKEGNILTQAEDGLYVSAFDQKPLLIQEYNEVSAVNDYPLYYAAIQPNNWNDTWEIYIKIKIGVKEDKEIYQVADLFIGGINSQLSYWKTKNFILNENKIEVISNVFLPSIEENKPHFLGLQLKDSSTKNRIIKLELYSSSNCNISFGSEIEEKSNLNYSSIYFEKNGFYSSNQLKKEDFSGVAFSGSYNDLIDTPDLLKVKYKEENEKIIFYEEGK